MDRRTIDLLDQCMADIRAERKSVAQCLADHPAERELLEGLLPIALAIVPPAVAPDPERKLKARYEFVEALHREREDRRSQWWRLRGLGWASPRLAFLPGVVAALVVALVASTSAVVAAKEALPGELLYGLKTGIEQVQVVIAVSPEGRAQVRLDLAAERLAEVEKALAAGREGAAQRAAVAYGPTMAQAAEEIGVALDRGTMAVALLDRLEGNMEREEGLIAKAVALGATSVREALQKAREQSHQGREQLQTRIAVAMTSPPLPQATSAKSPELVPPALVVPGEPARALSQLGERLQQLGDDPNVRAESYLSLKTYLEFATVALARGQKGLVASQLDAFASELNAMHGSGELADDQYDALHAGYRAVAKELGAEATSPMLLGQPARQGTGLAASVQPTRALIIAAAAEPTRTPTRTPEPTRTREPTPTPSPTPTATRAPRGGVSAQVEDRTPTPTPTRTQEPTGTPESTRTAPAGTEEPTRTPTATAVGSPTRTPAATLAQGSTAPRAQELTPTPTATAVTGGPTRTPTPTLAQEPSPTRTPGPSRTPTATVVSGATPTPTLTAVRAEPTPTPTPTAVLIGTQEPSLALLPTPTPEPSPTPSPTRTPQPSPTPSPTRTPTPTPTRSRDATRIPALVNPDESAPTPIATREPTRTPEGRASQG